MTLKPAYAKHVGGSKVIGSKVKGSLCTSCSHTDSNLEKYLNQVRTTKTLWLTEVSLDSRLWKFLVTTSERFILCVFGSKIVLTFYYWF